MALTNSGQNAKYGFVTNLKSLYAQETSYQFYQCFVLIHMQLYIFTIDISEASL